MNAQLTPASPLDTGLTADWMHRKGPELARRIVAKIAGARELALDYGLTESQWDAVRSSPYFRSLVAQAQEEAMSAAGISDRLRLKAMLILDQGGLLDMAGLLADSKVSPSVRATVFGELAAVAGLHKNKDGGGGGASQVGSGPLVVIQMANQQVNVGATE